MIRTQLVDGVVVGRIMKAEQRR